MESVRVVPRAALSRLTGHVAGWRRPRLVVRAGVALFSWWFRISLDEALVPEGGFKSLAELFNRSLKPGSRPIEGAAGDIVSPADSMLRSAGLVRHFERMEVKGLQFTVPELLGNDELSERFLNGAAFNFYLSPPDYHHVHSPCDGEIVKSRYVPGDLWPVNSWALRAIPKLFATNERLITFINTANGLVAVVMVGALNVGRISVDYDTWLTNSGVLPVEFERRYQPPPSIRRGDRLGTFHMGSAVILLLEKVPGGFDGTRRSDGPVKYGKVLLQHA